jgi:hypothetical protein
MRHGELARDCVSFPIFDSLRRTLRADLTSEYLCHVMNHMHTHGKSMATPTLRPQDANMQARHPPCSHAPFALSMFPQTRPWLDQLSSGCSLVFASAFCTVHLIVLQLHPARLALGAKAGIV